LLRCSQAGRSRPEDINPPLKCPSCEFDSFLETERCKRCGHVFGIDDGIGQVELIPKSAALEDPPEAEILSAEPEEPPVPESKTKPPTRVEEPPTRVAPAVNAGLMSPESLPAPAGVPPGWKAELDQRVQTFRKRRARARGVSDSNPNLEFDFEEQEIQEEEPVLPSLPSPEQPALVAAEIDVDLSGNSSPGPAELELHKTEAPPSFVEEPVIERVAMFETRDTPVEFVLDHAQDPPLQDSGPAVVEIHLAAMTRRLAGGLIDAGVLLFSAGVFGLIFWRAGGHFSTSPLTLLVLGFVVVFQVMVYFGTFTAVIAATPGQLWMGIEVRSMFGGAPTLRQSFWRALGCLVSGSALLLGFIWALFDNESLTWHDRMSETYLSPSEAVARQDA
jgi:uncharacterized RDD family membrane protein YckC